ncbi:MAG: O-antigen ligase family protein [Methanosarcinaceae archaeon]|nr:O-antigen ligase family protein [Methanosarcinaceae archaeon]
MSSIYLVIALSFIVILFRQDQREWPQFSYALWIPLVWLVSQTTRIIEILFPLSGFSGVSGVPSIEGSSGGNPISRMISISLILLGIVVIFKRKSTFSALVRANRGIFILYAYVLLTIVWSDYPEVSLKRYIRICGSLLIAIIVASEEDHHKALEHVFRRYVVICLTLSLFFIKTDRSIGYVIGVHGEHFMAGIASHKNELGVLCMVSLVFLFWRTIRLLPSVNYLDGILILINTYILIRARSTTALVLALLGMALILGMKMARGSLRNIVILVIILVLATLPILIITMNSPGSVISGAFFSAVSKDATLSGRTTMWNDLIRLGKKDIIQGSGYENYWIRHYKEIWAVWTFLPTNAHNGFVEVLLNLGLLGLAIVIVIILRLLFLLGSGDCLSQPSGHWYFVFLIMFIISNFTEASLIMLTLGWSLFLIISANNEKDRLMLWPSMIKSSPEN